MKGLRLAIPVFLLVFLGGMAVVLWLRPPSRPRPVPPEARRTAAVRDLPPLKLPETKCASGAHDSWEFTGETATNFVTARARFQAELLHQSWRLEDQITLEESLSPRVLMTFRKEELELVLMLWKIDAGLTGFAYRREKIVKPEVETL